MRREVKEFARAWWAHGGGAAILFLAIVTGVFRSPHDVLFWFSALFLVAHTVMALRYYLKSRLVRVTAVVQAVHPSRPVPVQETFLPPPITSLIPLRIPPNLLGKSSRT